MNVLFIHQNFPGQFLHLSADLAKDKGNTVVALTIDSRPAPDGVLVRPYALLRSPAADTHFLLRNQEAQVLRAEACAAAALQLKREGFTPDLIIAHPGWGEALFIKDVFPRAKLIVYCEYYYAAEGQDVGFDPEQSALTFAQRCQLRLKNSTNLLSMEIADAAISPTEWQKSTYPDWAQKKITVIHDGIDLERLQFQPAAKLALTGSDGAVHCFRHGDQVLSYVARNLEPVRGFHIFMRTLPAVLRELPAAHAIVVGGNEAGYGPQAPSGLSWKEHMLTELGDELDLKRVHFVGQVPYDTFLNLLSVSRQHSYWTAPFVLSWSFLEAAASGLPVLASATAPVREFADRLQVDMVDFHDQATFTGAMIEAVAGGRRRAPETLDTREISLPHCLARQRQLLATL